MADENLDAEFKRAFIASEDARKSKEKRNKVIGCLLVVVAIVALIIYYLVGLINRTADRETTNTQPPHETTADAKAGNEIAGIIVANNNADPSSKATPPLLVPPTTADDGLTQILPGCTPNWPGPCNDDLFKKVWATIEADNGELTKVDTNSFQHGEGGVTAVRIYTNLPGAIYDGTREKYLMFDCAGHYGDLAGPVQYDAPPGSVAGKIAALACAKAHN